MKYQFKRIMLLTILTTIFLWEPLKTSVEHLERQIYLSSTVYFL